MLADVTARANSLNAEAEEHLERAKGEAGRLLGAAREHAKDLLTRARGRADQIAVRTNEHSAKMLADAELRLAVLEEQRRVVDEYVLELRALSSADQLIAIDEPHAQLQLLSGAEEAEAPAAVDDEDDDADATNTVAPRAENE